MNIFIVEDSDSRIVREHIQIMLPDIPGIAVIGHASYNEPGLIERIYALLPDVVIINVIRHSEAMICVLRSIKERLATIKVMVLTNYPDEHFVDRCMRTGVDYLFHKVFFDEYSVNMRVRAFMRIRAALWKLTRTDILNNRLITLH